MAGTAPTAEQMEAWMREKRELEDRIRRLEALQQQHPPQPAPIAPQPNATLETARVPTAEEVNAVVSRLQAMVPEACDDSNAVFWRHVGTIVSNLLRPPYNEAKYRRLRPSNQTLAAEVFARPCARPVLCEVLGFTETAGQGDTILTLPPSTPAHITMLRAVQSALPRLVQRDDIAAEASRRFATFRKSVAFEVRMERLAEVVHRHDADDDDNSSSAGASSSATAVNRTQGVSAAVADFITSSLLYNDVDTATKIVSLLRSVSGNIGRDPSSEKFKALRFTSALVRDTVLPAQGAVEYLIAVLGFDWTDFGLALQLDGTDAEQVAAYRSRCAQGLGILDSVAHGVDLKRESENELRRKAALAEREAEKQRFEREERVAARMEKRRTDSSEDAHDHAAEAGDAPSPSKAKSGERIPIAEALRRLMGKSDDY
jgi:hypothetical protein